MDFFAAINDDSKKQSAVPVVIDPMDPTPLIKGFKSFEAQIDSMVKEATDHQVSDDDSNSQAVEMIGQAKKLSSAIESKRKDVTEPYLRVKSTVDAHVKAVRDRLGQIVMALENKIRPFLQQKEAERREAQRKADEEARRIQDEANRKAREEAERLAEEARKKAEAEGADKKAQEEAAMQAASVVEPVPVFVAASVLAETKTKTESGTASLKKEWTWELEDVRLLPDDIIKARWDEIVKAIAPAINPRIKAGIRSINGVRIFEQATVKTRSRR